MTESAITFDYKTVKVKREMETMVCDAYENLGWELTNTSTSEGNPFCVNLSFKRNRKIENKMELLKLQQKIDASLIDIESFQNKRKNAGLISAISMGTVGTLIFGGGLSMCLCLTGVGYLAGGIVLGVVGAITCGLTYLVYKEIRKKKVEDLTPIIESELDNLADLCEKASEIAK